MHRKIAFAAIAATAALAVPPAAAQAHITLQPKQAEAGAFTVQNVRVPNERDDAATVKVDVRLPDGFAFVSYQPKPGWKVKVTRETPEAPIKTPHGEMTEQVTRVTFTGDGEAGKIGPGQFMDFPLSVLVPGKAGDTLTFKALQTYSDGEVVRWIGNADSDKPAPTVSLTAPAEAGHGAAARAEKATPAAAATADVTAAADGKASQTLAVAALAVGALGLLVGLGAFAAGRRGGARA